MQDAKNILINQNSIILDALKQLELSKERLLICVDNDRRLVGVIGDGDIRRALIDGKSITSPIDICMTKEPVFVTNQMNFQDAMKLISYRVYLLPVVDELHRVVGYYSYKQKRIAEDIRLQTVAIFGMGYVGLTLAVSLADSGFNVIGYDINKELISLISEKKPPFFEVGLQSYLESLVGRNLQLYHSLDKFVADIFIVTAGTQIDKTTKKPDITGVINATRSVGKLLRTGNTVILRSTIPVGCSRNTILPELQSVSRLKCGEHFYFAYAPERTIEGKALLELRRNPQILGGYDSKSTEIVAQLFNTLTPSIINVGSLEAAEFCKLLDNCYRDHNFSFVNQFVPFAEHLGLDLCKLVDAVNFGYERCNVPKPSPGVGGPCLTKDPYVLAYVLNEHNLDSSLLLNARRTNESGPKHVYQKLCKLLSKAGKKDIDKAVISLIGIAFKGVPETSDMRESTSLKVLELLKKTTASIRVHDPIVPKRELARLGIEPVDLEGAFDGADAVIILNNHHSYSNWNLPSLLERMRHPAIFIDTWHIFEPADIKMFKGIIYGGLGND